jgi:sugar/nucleoside kinase (ribokinase family)
VAFGLAQRWDIPQLLRFASAVSSTVVGSLGAQTGLPTYREASQMLDDSP